MMSVEIVKMCGNDVVSDEVYDMSACPTCGMDFPSCYPRCPYCGDGPFDCEDGRGACSNRSDNSAFFLCSNCGRLYVPVQVLDDGAGSVDWKCCPGCLAVVE